MSDLETKTDKAVLWFMNQADAVKRIAVRELFDHAIRTEWVGVWSDADAKELAAEEGAPIEQYQVPYIRTCGEPIVKSFPKVD